MKYLVTGVAGFIGSATAAALLDAGHSVVGIDNLNDYYSVSLKQDRLAHLESRESFTFKVLDIADRDALAALFEEHAFERVIHLAAQAGVRYSLQNPMAYIDSNMLGMAAILEGCRHSGVQHLVFASSSSVYGMNEKIPFAEDDAVDHPVSLYAATKKSNELMAHSYAHLYQLPVTGLRFFTVYGPWGRPDMAPFLFTDAIANDRPIKVFNHGKMLRDFTYIDDIVEGVMRIQDCPPQANPNDALNSPATARAPYQILNIGNNEPIELSRFIGAIEKALGKRAQKEMLPMQDGDVPRTYADIDRLNALTAFKPETDIESGMQAYVDWYLDYYR
ncbi:MAG: NAD-dependent epimerase [Pseudomonadales bacterium]